MPSEQISPEELRLRAGMRLSNQTVAELICQREKLRRDIDSISDLLRDGSAPRPAPAEVELRKQVEEARELLERVTRHPWSANEAKQWRSDRDAFLEATKGAT